MTNAQKIFSPLNYGFRWDGDWYEFDDKAAHAAAKTARNEEAARLRKQGCTVKCFSLPKSLVSRGGIGSGHPHIELFITAYGLNVLAGGAL